LELVRQRVEDERQPAIVDVERAPECASPTLGLAV
jgi:hypothetical protein